MAEQFTPGPWTVTLTGRRGTFYIEAAHRHESEAAKDGVDGYTVSSANARLIAAAPAMLEALQEIAGSDPDAVTPDGRSVRAVVRAAIAAATGETGEKNG